MSTQETLRTNTDHAFTTLLDKLSPPGKFFPTKLGGTAFMFGGVRLDPIYRDGPSVNHLGVCIYEKQGDIPVVFRISAPDVDPPQLQAETQIDGHETTWDYDPDQATPDWVSKAFTISGLGNLVVAGATEE